jgi:hypothetical protein
MQTVPYDAKPARRTFPPVVANPRDNSPDLRATIDELTRMCWETINKVIEHESPDREFTVLDSEASLRQEARILSLQLNTIMELLSFTRQVHNASPHRPSPQFDLDSRLRDFDNRTNRLQQKAGMDQ